VLTREALRKRLWPDGITVDFDQSLNKCVTKLRDALKDSAASPRYIETLPKRGYRFIADVTIAKPPALSERQRVEGPRRPWLTVSGVAAVAFVVAISVGPTRAMPTKAARPERPAAAITPIYAARDAYERGRVAMTRRTAENLRAATDQFASAWPTRGVCNRATGSSIRAKGCHARVMRRIAR
jgi:hypothetical protein